MIRRGAHKYTFRLDDMPELYDLDRDRDEMHNLALDATHQKLVDQLKTELFAWYTPPERPTPTGYVSRSAASEPS